MARSFLSRFTGGYSSSTSAVRRRRRRPLSFDQLDARILLASSPAAGGLINSAASLPVASTEVSTLNATVVSLDLGIVPDGGPIQGSAQPVGYTPQQIRSAYGFDQIGGLYGSGQTIAIVDAYNDPNVYGDLDRFDQNFGDVSGGPTLYSQWGAASSFLTVVNQNGQTSPLPQVDPTGKWELEESLDVEWAHAMAPGARILLVEASSDDSLVYLPPIKVGPITVIPSQQPNDLVKAVATAADYPGVTVVSMSWGQPEFPNESVFDHYFTTPAGHQGVTFIASSGDFGYSEYPSASPNVLSVGGSTLYLNSSESYGSEITWMQYIAQQQVVSSGGGISSYENQPAYQYGVVAQSHTVARLPMCAIMLAMTYPEMAMALQSAIPSIRRAAPGSTRSARVPAHHSGRL